MTLKLFFVDFIFHFADAPQCWSHGDVICRVRSICADEEITSFSLTWRHVIDKLSEVGEGFHEFRQTQRVHHRSLRIRGGGGGDVQNHGGREPKCGSERRSAHNPGSDLIFCMKASLHNTSVPVTGSTGWALTGRRPPLRCPSVPRETIFPAKPQVSTACFQH